MQGTPKCFMGHGSFLDTNFCGTPVDTKLFEIHLWAKSLWTQKKNPTPKKPPGKKTQKNNATNANFVEIEKHKKRKKHMCVPPPVTCMRARVCA